MSQWIGTHVQFLFLYVFLCISKINNHNHSSIGSGIPSLGWNFWPFFCKLWVLSQECVCVCVCISSKFFWCWNKLCATWGPTSSSHFGDLLINSDQLRPSVQAILKGLGIADSSLLSFITILSQTTGSDYLKRGVRGYLGLDLKWFTFHTTV